MLTVAAEYLLGVLNISSFLLPKPSLVYERFVDRWPTVLDASMITVSETVIGFAISLVIAVSAGIAVTYIPWLRNIVYPVVVMSQTIPMIAVAPLLIVWFGFGLTPKVIVVVLIAAFPMVISSITGFSGTDPNSMLLIRSMGGGAIEQFRRVRLVAALPSLFGGFKMGVTLSLVGALIAEFVGSDAGIGYELIVANSTLDTALVFVYLLVLCVIGVSAFALVSSVELLLPRDPNRK